jgi:flagellar motor switch protein FliN/FliY
VTMTSGAANPDASNPEATLGPLLGGSVPVDEPSMGGPSVAPATLPSLDRAAVVPANRNIEILSDVVTRVSVEIACGTAEVGDLVSMTRGSVFELDREAGDAVDVLVNGAMVARGDIVVVGKQLGVRITKVCGAED